MSKLLRNIGIGLLSVMVLLFAAWLLQSDFINLFPAPEPNCAVETADCYERLMVCEADLAETQINTDIEIGTCTAIVNDIHMSLGECTNQLATAGGELDIVESILIDVPGDRLEEKISRVLHELEVCNN